MITSESPVHLLRTDQCPISNEGHLGPLQYPQEQVGAVHSPAFKPWVYASQQALNSPFR